MTGRTLLCSKYGNRLFQFFDKIKEFKSFKIRNFTVGTVNERYRTTLDGKYEITLSSESIVEPIDEKIPIPFNPLPLDKVLQAAADSVIDVMGVFVFAEEARKTSSNKRVREVALIDQSKNTVPVYFWERDADDFQMPMKKPIGLYKVQVKKYGDEKVIWFQRSSTATTTDVDPDGTMAAWFNELTDGYM